MLTSHVAQIFVDDAEWARTLGDLRRALVPGGRLAFDARDPADRRWERWNPADSRRRITLPDGGELRSSATLRFRTEAELCDSLTTAGFTVDRIHGGWHGEPVGRGDGEFVVIARADTLAPVF
ncbi:hypothetical protein C7C45_11125 [Micromonospora arborensis]|uniref:Methyltransferase n=1 Tax=Micromonospora arborensis TaxID=2116518 RepID=A0A318NL07_9ACTN|nr:hypothetical protein [Micromonospora arborensis]PYC71578.1 hypothetical protein C7C45_11125 [Micromonospora arborensis]